jgi:SAM-dependent methyltransferase
MGITDAVSALRSLDPTAAAILRCPVDHGTLVLEPAGPRCQACGRRYQDVDGCPDLAYSPLPDVDGHVPYLWSDVFHLENILRQLVRPESVVLEVCSGPNIVVPLLLKRLGRPVTYLSVGMNTAHLRQQKQGVNFPIQSIRGDATALPLAADSVDLYLGHHAINDIWLTKGEAGVTQSYQEMDRVLKEDGYLIQSDCVLQHDSRVGDPSTRLIDLESLIRFLDQRPYRWERSNGGELNWIVASPTRSCRIEPSPDYTI